MWHIVQSNYFHPMSDTDMANTISC